MAPSRLDAIEERTIVLLTAARRALSPERVAGGLVSRSKPGREPREEADVISASPPPAPVSPFEQADALLRAGANSLDEDLLGRLNYREIDKLERQYSRKLSWSIGDPDAPFNRRRRASSPEMF